MLRPTILVIDDVEEVRDSLRRTLEGNGFKVVLAQNGRQGLKAVVKYLPDVVLTDIIMPDMEGLETIQKLQKSKPNLPIIAMTASKDTPYLQASLKFGAVSALYKPFTQHELLTTVRKALGIS